MPQWEIVARKGTGSWPVRIRACGHYLEVSARGTGFIVYITETDFGYLVSVPNHQRCGHVPGDCNARDVIHYVGVENEADATTLAAAIRYLVAEGFVPRHPAIADGSE
ncbi:MAG: hypothetical protein IRY98_11915 [Alicyclobacillaceae bacterium]|nr:hypothetical protein [Alicyclobacillaceae bacterium]